MRYVALATWLVAALAGSYLLLGWVRDGGGLQATKVTRFPRAVVLGHPAVAVVGFGIWIAFVVTADETYAWSAVGALVVVAFLGFMMLTRWLVGRGGRHSRAGERDFPVVAVAVHGVVAAVTFVLVLLTAMML